LFTYAYYLAGDWECSDKIIDLDFSNKPSITAEIYPNEIKGRILLCASHPEYMIWRGGEINEIQSSIGTIYAPVLKDGKKAPGIFVLHGSEGGGRSIAQLEAMYFASKGYISVSYCYKSCLDLKGRKNIFETMKSIYNPDTEFINIEISKVMKALEIFSNLELLKDQKIGILGFSKGAELALILGSLEEDLGLYKTSAIAVHAPTDTIEEGFSWNWWRNERGDNASNS